MTERIDIAKARELLDGTTKGAWGTDGLYLVKYVDKDDIVYHSRFLAEFDLGNEANALWIAHAHNTYAALLDELEGARAREETCEWSQEDRDGRTWHCSVCGACWTLNDGTPEENDMRFCPECGRRVVKCNKWRMDDDDEQEGRT
jgi:hypothetical protein